VSRRICSDTSVHAHGLDQGVHQGEGVGPGEGQGGQAAHRSGKRQKHPIEHGGAVRGGRQQAGPIQDANLRGGQDHMTAAHPI